MAAAEQQTLIVDEVANQYSVDEALSHIGLGHFQYRLLFITGLIRAADSMELMLLSFLVPTLQSVWHLQPPMDGSIAAVIFAGFLIGSLVFAIIADKHGRKSTIIIGCVLGAIFAFLSGLAPSIFVFLIFRFMVGFSTGSVHVAYTLFAEYLPAEYRGRLVMIQASFWSFGGLLSVLFAYIFLYILNNWRLYLIASSFPFFIASALSIYYLPESVRYLLIKGDVQSVEQILQHIADVNGTALPENGQLRPVEHIEFNRGRVRDLFVPSYRVNSVVVLSTFAVVKFSYFGISFVSDRFFMDISNVSTDHYWMMAVSTASELISIVIGYVALDKIGTKKTLNVTLAVFACCFFLSWMYEEYQVNATAAVTTISVGRMCIHLAFNALYLYFSIYYPTAIRSTALGTAHALGRILSIVTSFVSEDLSVRDALIVYSLTSVFLFVLSMLLKKDEIGQELPSTVLKEREQTSDFAVEELADLRDAEKDICDQ